ncbi:MAG: thioredoxin TrxC [Thermodesulfobacteriota bacterium]
MTAGAHTFRCPSCGAPNRVQADRLGDRPRCGKCRAPLDTTALLAGKPVVVTDRNFEAEVLRSPLPVLLDCWAPWCGPCRLVGPVMDELAREWRGRVRTAKLNVDENQQTAARFGIRSIPTLLVFEGGQLRETMVGALPKTEIKRRLAPFLRG